VKFTVFQSDKGDCLLLTGNDGTHVLVDGGMGHAFRRHVAPALAALREAGHRLDLVYVSHIDEDHISGVLQLMNDLVAWRVHDHQVGHDNPSHPQPQVPRPPDVAGIWHNAFHEARSRNKGAIADMLAATAGILSGSDDPRLRRDAARRRDLAQSEKQAHQLSRRIGARQLNIPLNAPWGHKLAMVRDGDAAVAVGGLEVFVLAPFEADLKVLRTRWNAWLKKSAAALAEIRRQARETERLLGNEVDGLLLPLLWEAGELGRRKDVTPPNLASLMLLVRENGRTALLTGDGHADEVRAGLDRHQLRGGGRLHVDVLKVQHHGAAANMDEDFAQHITADHYVFCGNGSDENPELEVVELIAQSRLTDGTQRPFTMWFNSSPAAATTDERRDHMQSVVDLVEDMKQGAQGRLRSFFLEDSAFELQV
jgi:beta-lactamase superfamily II metal-dependent hydrolase